MAATKKEVRRLDIDIQTILSNGKVISSQEALNDTTPVSWDQDVLSGKYKDKVIIKSANEK